jgi:hypothetical protein
MFHFQMTDVECQRTEGVAKMPKPEFNPEKGLRLKRYH